MRNSIWRVASSSVKFWVRFPEYEWKNQIVPKQVKVYFFPLRVKSHIHMCQDVRHVFPLALSASPDFWNKHGLNAVRWARASLRNTSSCLCNTTIVCCPSSGQRTGSLVLLLPGLWANGKARCQGLTEYGNSRQSAEIQAFFFSLPE